MGARSASNAKALAMALAVAAANAVGDTMNPLTYKISNPPPGRTDGDSAVPFRGSHFTIDSPSFRLKYAQVYWRTLPPVDLPPEIVAEFSNSTMGVTGFEVDVLRRDAETGKEESVPAYHSYNHHYSPNIFSSEAKLKLDEDGQPTGVDRGHGKVLEFELANDDDGRERSSSSSSSSSSPFPSNARLVQAFVHGNGQEHRNLFHGMPKGYSQPIYRPAKFVLHPMQISTNDGTAQNRNRPGTLLPKFSRERFPPDSPFSPLLECPCTDRTTKEAGRTYTEVKGNCRESPRTEGECFDAAARAVASQGGTVIKNETVPDPSLPAGGCLVYRTAAGTSAFRTAFNTYSSQGNDGDVGCDFSGGKKDASGQRLTGSVKDVIAIGLDVDGAADSVTITLAGPSDAWFGVGFNATTMSDQPYAVIVDGEGRVEERRLGNHLAGDVLPASVEVVSNTVDAKSGLRTVVLERPLQGATKDHFSFYPDMATIPLINALGDMPDLQQHAQRGAATLAMFRADPDSPTCLCADGTGSINGVPYDGDCLPEPISDLLVQDNPTCSVSSYVGGLACCSHGALLLDADQVPPLPDFEDEVFFRFRFYYEDYDETTEEGHSREVNHVEWSQNGCDSGLNCRHIEFDVVRGTGSDPVPGTPAGPNVQVFQSTFKAGQMLAKSCSATDGPCMDARKVELADGTFSLVTAATHCHAPNCLRQDLIDVDKNEVLCSAVPVLGESSDVFHEAGYLYAPPCVWGSTEEGLRPPPVLRTNTTMRMVTYFDSTWGHTGQMGIWQMKAAYGSSGEEAAASLSPVRGGGESLFSMDAAALD